MILSESCLRDTGDFRESKIADTVEEATAKLTIHLIATIMKEDRGTQVPQASGCSMSAHVIDKETRCRDACNIYMSTAPTLPGAGHMEQGMCRSTMIKGTVYFILATCKQQKRSWRAQTLSKD